MDACTSAKLIAAKAVDHNGKPMVEWFPQDYKFGDSTQKCIHFTYIFQVFVILQLFNQINSRFIQEGEFNILKGFFSNKMFLVVYLFEWVFQFLMVEVGGMVTKCYPLSFNQNLICIGFGFISVPWGAIIKFFPLKHFNFKVDDDPMSEEEKMKTATSFAKKSTIRKKEIRGLLEEGIKKQMTMKKH